MTQYREKFETQAVSDALITPYYQGQLRGKSLKRK